MKKERDKSEGEQEKQERVRVERYGEKGETRERDKKVKG